MVDRVCNRMKVFLQEKKGEKETCPILDQFLSHVAKTGETMIPFTIQRLCELLTEPKRNYAGTDKFLRGVEKNVMVVSCVYPTSEKKGSGCVNRMNGVMFPGNASPHGSLNQFSLKC
uniref:Serine/threonine-protein phosphatase 4 regulatory subunit 2-A-like n=1 Tax=Sinocyclocheilus grahami TaxID=75366 RepID=A0A672Q893_SINGR